MYMAARSQAPSRGSKKIAGPKNSRELHGDSSIPLNRGLREK
jgi:hypothetical protein